MSGYQFLFFLQEKNLSTLKSVTAPNIRVATQHKNTNSPQAKRDSCVELFSIRKTVQQQPEKISENGTN